ncbi:hypothetical protein ACWC5I_17035 [Kitasatospora sp. NPDC001574]
MPAPPAPPAPAVVLPAPPDLTYGDRRLLRLIAANAPVAQVAAETGLPPQTAAVNAAADDLLRRIGARTRAQAAAWATAHRIVTATVEPCAALAAPVRPTGRQLQVLRGWCGGRTDDELAAEYTIALPTLRGYAIALRGQLGVRRKEQACVAGILAGHVRLSDIDPLWPAVPLEQPFGAGPAAA